MNKSKKLEKTYRKLHVTIVRISIKRTCFQRPSHQKFLFFIPDFTQRREQGALKGFRRPGLFQGGHSGRAQLVEGRKVQDSGSRPQRANNLRGKLNLYLQTKQHGR